MCDKLTPLSHFLLDGKSEQLLAIYRGQPVNKQQFIDDVKTQVHTFTRLKTNHAAIYYEEAYLFCVSLFALFYSDKQVWIASNNTPETAEKLINQGCELIGDWQGKRCLLPTTRQTDHSFSALVPADTQLMLYTSGSSGDPKTIKKTLQQLQTEIYLLEQQWGEQLAQSYILATVSHQHVYGLLFRLLWPLSAGRCFFSQMFLSPEPMLKAADDRAACWIASPAQLKRLDRLSPWQAIAKLQAVFSSGGFLPEKVSRLIYQLSGQKVIEVYGSTETGGIGWRQIIDQALWTPFKSITFFRDDEDNLCLCSPFLAEGGDKTGWLCLDDKLEIEGTGQFKLIGRRDRLVKIEEKRLSLNELEQTLNQTDWIQQCHTLLICGKRDKIACVLVLTESGQKYQHKFGRSELIKQIRKQLMRHFETVVLPRKWLFMSSIPLTAQAKIDQLLLRKLLTLDSKHFPRVQSCHLSDHVAALQLKVPAGLVYFSGHFPEQPILPGVTQLAWVETLAKILFDIQQPFSQMEVIKFKKIIRPEMMIKLHLNWKAATGKLYFNMDSEQDSHSSGRMVYGVRQ